MLINLMCLEIGKQIVLEITNKRIILNNTVKIIFRNKIENFLKKSIYITIKYHTH